MGKKIKSLPEKISLAKNLCLKMHNVAQSSASELNNIQANKRIKEFSSLAGKFYDTLFDILQEDPKNLDAIADFAFLLVKLQKENMKDIAFILVFTETSFFQAYKNKSDEPEAEFTKFYGDLALLAEQIHLYLEANNYKNLKSKSTHLL